MRNVPNLLKLARHLEKLPPENGDLPTNQQIGAVTAPLRQACDLAVQIDGIGAYAPDFVVNAHKVQFVHQFHTAARALGLELVRRDGPRVVVDNTAEPNTMREMK